MILKRLPWARGQNLRVTWYLAGLLLCYSGTSDATVKLEKFYEHIGQTTDKIVFYFKHIPTIQHKLVPLSDAPRWYRSEKFIFNNVQFGSAEIKRALHNFQAQHQKFYRLKFKQIPAGLELILIYDVRQVQCVQCHRFKAISGFEGVVLKIEHALSHKRLRGPTSQISGPSVAVALVKQTPTEATTVAPLATKQPLKLVLDYGHGGTDTGARGVSPQPEKALTLAVGLKLKILLEQAGFTVLETRSDDRAVALDARTSFANLVGGVAAFISLHANHASNAQAAGIEIYYADDHLLNRVTLNSLATACQFNLQGEPSKALANTVLAAMLQAVSTYGTANRQVRCSLSQVLLGVEQMLGILIEMGYLSNPAEAQLLNDEQYQWLLARGIANGVCQYFSVPMTGLIPT